jgi:hypothetical protein
MRSLYFLEIGEKALIGCTYMQIKQFFVYIGEQSAKWYN